MSIFSRGNDSATERRTDYFAKLQCRVERNQQLIDYHHQMLVQLYAEQSRLHGEFYQKLSDERNFLSAFQEDILRAHPPPPPPVKNIAVGVLCSNFNNTKKISSSLMDILEAEAAHQTSACHFDLKFVQNLENNAIPGCDLLICLIRTDFRIDWEEYGFAALNNCTASQMFVVNVVIPHYAEFDYNMKPHHLPERAQQIKMIWDPEGETFYNDSSRNRQAIQLMINSSNET
jgi:hypothetical protein